MTYSQKRQNQRSRILKNLLSVVCLVMILTFLAWASLDALDRSIYPGCKVMGEEVIAPGIKVLKIKLNPEISDHTDMSCMLAGQLIYRITRDGYLVHVVDSHLTSIGLIDSKRAREMAEGY